VGIWLGVRGIGHDKECVDAQVGHEHIVFGQICISTSRVLEVSLAIVGLDCHDFFFRSTCVDKAGSMKLMFVASSSPLAMSRCLA